MRMGEPNIIKNNLRTRKEKDFNNSYQLLAASKKKSSYEGFNMNLIHAKVDTNLKLTNKDFNRNQMLNVPSVNDIKTQ